MENKTNLTESKRNYLASETDSRENEVNQEANLAESNGDASPTLDDDLNVAEQAIDDAVNKAVRNSIKLKVNGEEKEYDVAELQKLAAASKGFNELKREREVLKQQEAAMKAQQEKIIEEARAEEKAKMEETLRNELPNILQKEVERVKKFEGMNEVEKQIHLQKEEIARIKQQYEATQQENMRMQEEMQRQQQAAQVENARQYYNTFFAENKVNNPYIKNSFLRAVDELQQNGFANINYTELLGSVQDKYHQTLTEDVGGRAEEELAEMLGEEKLAKLQNYLLRKNKENKTTSAQANETLAERVMPEDDGREMLRALI